MDKTIIINGRTYDKETGMPVEEVRSTAKEESDVVTQTEESMHSNAASAVTSFRKQRTMSDITRSPHISRFAAPAKQQSSATIADIGPTKHPLLQKLSNKKTSSQQKTAAVLKQEAITTALSNARPSAFQQPSDGRSPFFRMGLIGIASLAIIILGGYVTYTNIPVLSTHVAAIQSGIKATFPNYRPNGYTLSGPVAYEDGRVSMKFSANAGPQQFTLTQQRSGWDSSAVKDQYVFPAAGEDFLASTVNGLTIFMFKESAAWVNDGILYTIKGSAPLSSEQVQRIAVSL